MSRASPFFRRPMYSNPFVGSDYYDNKKRSDLAAAAIKIQKAFRGFLVRKNLRIAREIEAVVDEIEMKFMREREMDLIVRDEKKERLRINEMLMRLDLVRGVRDYRKRVVRRVIALQEMVDSISAGRSAERTLETASEELLETKPDAVVEEVKPLGDDYHFGALPPKPTIPKVVSTPVHFVGSDDDNKKRTDRAAAAAAAAAAIKIQKAFRGFVVRKNVRIAPEIEAVVDEIEMKFMRKQEMDLIVRDEKERLRINEMLMRLLFRLDLVPRVRDYRKRVIQRVIALQEMVDSISAGRSAEQTLQTVSEESMETKPDAVLEEVKTLEDEYEIIEMAESKPIEESETLETANQVDPMEMHQEVKAKTLESGDQQISAGCELLKTKVGDAEAENQESLMEEGSIPGSTVGSSAQKVEKERSIDDATPAAEPRKNQERGVKDMMERVVAENEKLKGLVALLCERSTQQCRLMGGLAQRVEHLEKIVEKMERKKKTKRKDSSSTAANFC